MSQRARELAWNRASGRRKAQPSYSEEEPDAAAPLTPRQRLSSARGVFLGLMIAAVLWALLALAVLAWRGLMA